MTDNELNVRILVVDGDVEHLQAMRSTCESDPRIEAVTTVETGAEALRVLRSDDRFDAVLCDERLSDVRGVQVLTHTRHAHPGMLRILLSRYRDQDAVVNGINEARIHHYVEKPIDPSVLTDRVSDLVERRELEASLNGEIYHHARSMARSIQRRRHSADPTGTVDA